MMLRIASIATGLFLAAALGTHAGEARKFPFEIRANGFRYGDFLVVLQDDDETYTVDVSAEAKGIFGFMLRAKYSGTSSGKIKVNGIRQGGDFKARSSRIFANRSQRVTYENSLPKAVSITPSRRRTALSDPANITGSFNDPLSFLANLVVNPLTTCPSIADLYDGRRITKVTLVPDTSRPDILTCTGTYDIIQGPDHSLQKGVRAFNLKAIYDTRSPGSLVLESVEFQSGSNVILLARLHR